MSISNTVNFSLRRNIWMLSSPASSGQFYIFAAKATPWPNDLSPPNLDNSVYLNEYQINNEILFGNYVGPAGISLMANRYDWTSGTVYNMYDDQDINLFDEPFYVITQEAGQYNVFKCLNNAGGIPSTVQPLLSQTSPDSVYYVTSDGYQWKYLYSINSTQYDAFATSQFIPVISNGAVEGNAISGAIESYSIISGGSNYNSYTNGYFTDIAVGGNSQYFGLQGSDTTILSISSNTYNVGETVTQIYGGMTVTGTVVSQSTVNNSVSHLTLRNVNNIFEPTVNTITGYTSGSKSSVYDATSPNISSNANFYNGCSLYISSGTGAGQVGVVSEYVVTGNSRRVLLANAFPTLPDYTSKYIISPRVTISGDGTGATGLSVIDPNTKVLSSIQVLSKGSGYSYANVGIVGNTGTTSIAANNASVRAILSPRGGHGYDVFSELDATYLAYSTKFANNEGGKIPGTGSQYRRIGIIANPLYANVGLTYTYSSAPPALGLLSGGTIHGSNSGAEGIITGGTSGSIYSLSNVSGIFNTSDILTGFYANGIQAFGASYNVLVTAISGQSSVFNNRVQLICQTSSLSGGTFSVGEKIVTTFGGIDQGYGYIQEIDTGGSNTYIYLAEVKGNFTTSDVPSGHYKYIYDDASRSVSIQLNSVISSDLVPYTGDILYVENIQPVTRNSLQSETVKLIVGFS